MVSCAAFENSGPDNFVVNEKQTSLASKLSPCRRYYRDHLKFNDGNILVNFDEFKECGVFFVDSFDQKTPRHQIIASTVHQICDLDYGHEALNEHAMRA